MAGAETRRSMHVLVSVSPSVHFDRETLSYRTVLRTFTVVKSQAVIFDLSQTCTTPGKPSHVESRPKEQKPHQDAVPTRPQRRNASPAPLFTHSLASESQTSKSSRKYHRRTHHTVNRHGSISTLIIQSNGYVGHLIHPQPNHQSRHPPKRTANHPDNHNRLVADILTRYRTLMMLATVQAEGERNNATPETMAVSGISMKMEFDGLVSPPPPSILHPLTGIELLHQGPLVAVAQN